ncbi:MAG: CZB domain-containing protein [Alphaproteobacteria bacterium]|nr:CZB domain-containing protein [Alphaproteobacteria bacterium]
MTIEQEITKAIGAHGLWKGRLGSIIATGSSDIAAEKIALDNACDFGRWLYSPALDAAVKLSAEYVRCRELHAQFHKAAAETARLALAGKRAEAEKSMAPGGAFFEASLALTQVMLSWKRAKAA